MTVFDTTIAAVSNFDNLVNLVYTHSDLTNNHMLPLPPLMSG